MTEIRESPIARIVGIRSYLLTVSMLRGSRLSIKTKWPLAAAGLILVVGASISAAAYLVIRQTLEQSARERLTTLEGELRTSLAASVSAMKARVAAVARRPDLAAYLANPSPAREAAAKKGMQQGGPNTESIVRTELRDRSGQLVLLWQPVDDVAPSALDQVDGPTLAGLVPASESAVEADTVGHGDLIQVGEALYYPIAAAVPGTPGGFYVTWRRVTDATQTRQRVAAVFGSEGALYYGSIKGAAWSDLGRPIAPPGVAVPGGISTFQRQGRGRVLAATAPIAGTPWAFSIEFPMSAVYAPAQTFLRIVTIIATSCILLGMAVAWASSRRVASQVQALTMAADAIAAGSDWRGIDGERNDELGRLAASFNAMALQIKESQHRLEDLVAKRTGELHAAKDSLARREKLALVGQLAGSILHEIRNPLGVMSNAVFYLQVMQPDAPPEVREYLAMLRQQVELSAKIVNDLLDLSRTKPVARERVGLHEVVSSRLQRVPMRGAKLETDIPSNLPAVHADPAHAGHVLDNLLTNATQALDGSGTVTVRARETGDGFVRIEVADTGPGIPPENVGKIFEPLFTTKARGIGLGLALAKSLAQANGGDLELVSQPGQGARFAFTLPVAEGSA